MKMLNRLFAVMTLCLMAVVSIAGVDPDELAALLADQTDWQVPETARQMENPIRYDVASVMQGKSLFDKHCLVCHGYWGEGNGIIGLALDNQPANLLKIAGKQSAGAFAWKIAEGRGDMPGFREELDMNQIWMLVNFVESLENEEGSLDNE